ncbi:hypothetical protein, partial [Vibrio cholerae]|uniref:hypothetical protein n=2 Tax=Vibrio cholerae TaxID=666 RepID=UPI003075B03F
DRHLPDEEKLMLDIQDIQCRKIREQTLHQAGGTCALAWQVGFFFDGIHRNSHWDSESGVYPIPFVD